MTANVFLLKSSLDVSQERVTAKVHNIANAPHTDFFLNDAQRAAAQSAIEHLITLKDLLGREKGEYPKARELLLYDSIPEAICSVQWAFANIDFPKVIGKVKTAQEKLEQFFVHIIDHLGKDDLEYVQRIADDLKKSLDLWFAFVETITN